MSNLILPSLPIGIKIEREPFANVIISESANGKEARSSWWYTPRHRYSMSFDVLRTSNLELSKLIGFFAQHFYSLDSFLIQTNDDYTVTNHGFGVGDASTLSFQLQRTQVTSVTDKSGGPWTVATTPTKNWLKGSSDSSRWTLTNMSSGAGGVDPSGLWTALLLTATDTGASIAQAVTGLAASTHTFSVWLKAGTATTCTINGTSKTLTTSWARYSVNLTPTAGALTPSISFANGSNLYFWGAQLEIGSTYTLLIPTTSDAVTRTPAYYPNFTDGFEPIYETANDVSIMLNGSAAEYASVGPYGVVTFSEGHAPASGDVLTWSGSYYQRVRLDGGGLPFERIVDGAYRTGTVKFIEVLP
jgi:hypothetical protein